MHEKMRNNSPLTAKQLNLLNHVRSAWLRSAPSPNPEWGSLAAALSKYSTSKIVKST